MTTTAASPAPARASALREAWRVSPAGVRLVAGLELRQRVRSTKWTWSLAAVAVLVGAVTALLWAANTTFTTDTAGRGDVVFAFVVFFVLFIGLVVSPTLSATSINGDVRDGTMAPLQATGLSAADIVLGKLLASWAASLAFLAVSLPFLFVAYFAGAMPAVAMIQVVVVLAVELLVVCALGLGWSALTARTAASSVLTYTTVAVLTAILPIVFGLSAAVFNEQRVVTYRDQVWVDYASADPKDIPDDAIKSEWGDYYRCEEHTYIETQPRTDLTWWMLAVNPYVIVADSAPSPTLGEDGQYQGDYVLSSLKQGVREVRLGGRDFYDYCSDEISAQELERREELNSLPPLWPWGLAVQALLGVGAVALGVRRLAVPYGKLPTGSRVA